MHFELLLEKLLPHGGVSTPKEEAGEAAPSDTVKRGIAVTRAHICRGFLSVCPLSVTNIEQYQFGSLAYLSFVLAFSY